LIFIKHQRWLAGLLSSSASHPGSFAPALGWCNHVDNIQSGKETLGGSHRDLENEMGRGMGWGREEGDDVDVGYTMRNWGFSRR
jgi:hypothetical protein